MKKDTRNILIATAKELIGASSYASVGVAEICKHAGVNKGSFYHFFDSKEELAIQALKEEMVIHETELNIVFSATKPAMEQLDGIIERFYNHQQDDFKQHGKVCGCPFLNLGAEMATQKESFVTCINSITSKYEMYLTSMVQKFISEELIDKNTDANMVGKILNTYFLGLKFIAKIENNPKVMKDELKQTLLNIIGVK